MRYIVNEYNLYSSKINNNRDIVCISDIHSDIVKMKKIRDILKKLNISTLLISGDLVDAVNDKRNDELYEIFKSISLFTSIYIVKGNHDVINFDSKRKEIFSSDNSFFKNISAINNIKVFNDDLECISLFDDINLSAITMPIDWYNSGEDSADFEKRLLDSLDVNVDKFNILLSHSPNGLIKDNLIKKYLNYCGDMNLILCGHMHGGLVPMPFRNKSHKGLFGPYSSFFPKTAYGVYHNDNSSLIISGGVTKISNSSELYSFSSFFDNFFASELELIHLISSDENDLKLIKKIKY